MSTVPGTASKGKGKADDVDLGDGGDGDDDDVKGEKKKKNTYKHLIKGIPGVLLNPFVLILLPSIFPQILIYLCIYLTGKHSLKKDDSLTKIMLVPPKQKMRIAQFDLRTQEEAFTVSLEGLKGVRSPTSLLITNLNYFITSVEYQHSCLRIGSSPGRSKKEGTFDFSLVTII